jgi:hypothetical protein
MARRPRTRRQTEVERALAENRAHVAAQRRLALLVGAVAIGLPPLLVLMGLPCWRQSLSSYYFDPRASDVLVAGLAAMATCLLAFVGNRPAEAHFTTAAAAAALGVAMVPTDQVGCPLEVGYEGRFHATLARLGDRLVVDPATPAEAWLSVYEATSFIHHAAALGLVLFLAYLCFREFAPVVEERHTDPAGRPTRAKARRNGLYRASGLIIVACVLLMILGGVLRARSPEAESWWDRWNLTLWVEWVALWAFGTAWLVKGRVLGWLLRDPAEPAP